MPAESGIESLPPPEERLKCAHFASAFSCPRSSASYGGRIRGDGSGRRGGRVRLGLGRRSSVVPRWWAPERGPWDAWTLLAGLAGATERVTLGPLVACTAFSRPGVLARTAAAVDELSGGRLVVRYGAGWNEDGVPRRNLVRPSHRALHRGVRDHPPVVGRRASDIHRCHEAVADAVLLPAPARRPQLMVGPRACECCDPTLPVCRRLEHLV